MESSSISSSSTRVSSLAMRSNTTCIDKGDQREKDDFRHILHASNGNTIIDYKIHPSKIARYSMRPSFLIVIVGFMICSQDRHFHYGYESTGCTSSSRRCCPFLFVSANSFYQISNTNMAFATNRHTLSGLLKPRSRSLTSSSQPFQKKHKVVKTNPNGRRLNSIQSFAFRSGGGVSGSSDGGSNLNSNQDDQNLLFQYPKRNSDIAKTTPKKKRRRKRIRSIMDDFVNKDNDADKGSNHNNIEIEKDHDRIKQNSNNHNDSPYNHCVTIDKDSIINLDGSDTISFYKSLYVQGKIIGKIQCTCLDEHKSNDLEGEEECMTTLLHIGESGILVSKNDEMDCISDVFVEGTLIGNINCDRLIMTRNGVLIGNIVAKSM